MKRFKRLLSTLLVCCLLTGLFPATALAAETVASGICGDNLTWVLDSDGTLTISGTGEMYDYTQSPWKSVVVGGAVKAVVIQNGVTVIGRNAFYDCDSIEGITIPDSVTTIKYCAFFDCDNLAEVYIPKSVTSIEGGVFNHDGLLGILSGIWVDEDNPNYKSDTFGVLYSKDSKTIIQAPTKLSGEYIIPEGVEEINVSTFNGCVKLVAVTIPDSVTTINGNAFYNCESLTSVAIPEGVTVIHTDTFKGCRNMVSVWLPKSITEIHNSAFENCLELKDVYYAGNESDWDEINIGNMNNYHLTKANIHYSSTQQPPNTGNEPGDPGDDDTKPDTPENPKPDDDTKPDIPEDSNSDNDITSYTLAFHTSLEGRNTDAYIDTEWGWDLFLDSETYPSTRYESRLAVAGLALSAASEYSQNRVEEMLEELGFESDLILSQNYNADWHDLSSPGVTFAHKSVKHNGEDMHVIVAVLRGTT